MTNYQRAHETRLSMDQFWDSFVVAYYVKTQTMVAANRAFRNEAFNEEIASELLLDPEFKNLVAMNNLFLGSLVGVQKRVIANIDEALSLMNRGSKQP